MTIILVGLNHRTAPVELREQLALTGGALPEALAALRHEGRRESDAVESGQPSLAALREGLILSTCNRLEIYASTDSAYHGSRFIEGFIARLEGFPAERLRPHLYFLEGEAAVRHLMRVAGGLDSMILGEPQILGQVTAAFRAAQNAGLIGPVLSHLLAQAIHAGKRARSETPISRFTTSVSHAGARLVLEKLPPREDRSAPEVLVVGAGEMATLAARSLRDRGVQRLAFINRTTSHADALAAKFDGRSLNWGQLGAALSQVDAVISATHAPHTVIHAQDVEQALAGRNGRGLLFVDIAVPRDVEVSVGDLPGVQRCDIDDLQSIVDANTAQRQAAIPQVEAIIEQELAAFFEWYYSRQVKPVIQGLRRWASDVAQTEVEQALNRLDGADEHTARVVNRLAHRLVNKLLHEPTVRLRGQAAEGNGYGYAHIVSELFGLEPDSPDDERERDNGHNGSE
jgi:glutamyl-tRNA reductase